MFLYSVKLCQTSIFIFLSQLLQVMGKLNFLVIFHKNVIICQIYTKPEIACPYTDRLEEEEESSFLKIESNTVTHISSIMMNHMPSMSHLFRHNHIMQTEGIVLHNFVYMHSSLMV